MNKLSVVIITGNNEKLVSDAVSSAGFSSGAKTEPSQGVSHLRSCCEQIN